MTASGTASVALTAREKSLCNGINPWLAPVAMVLTQDVALKGFFGGGLTVLGRENLPDDGPVLLAPTHRSRWDALMLPHAAGRRVTGRDCRFMVTSDEMTGLQGWFLHRLGCFPVNPRKPAAASLRFAAKYQPDRPLSVDRSREQSSDSLSHHGKSARSQCAPCRQNRAESNLKEGQPHVRPS